MRNSPAFFCFLFIQLAGCFPFASRIGRTLHTRLSLAITSDELASNVTLRYSHSFRRHIVEQHGIVLQSYVWFDEAIQKYPRAQLLSVKPIAMIAGTSVHDHFAYPLDTEATNVSDNQLQITNLLHQQLNWTVHQVNTLFDQWPDVSIYPVDELSERIHFFMAPPPEPELLYKVNFTENIDWPVQLYRHGRGCGLSLAQVSHALQTIPQFVLRLPQLPLTQSVDRTFLQWNDATPSIVVTMTMNRLEAWLAGTPASETILLAFLHYNGGWDWVQYKLFLHAFPAVLQPALETSWDIKGRNQLRPDVVHYLQTRLQLRPWHLQAMFRTHSSLTGYDLAMVQRNMDFLQGTLQLYSEQLRQILQEMPSLFGVSTSSLQQRLDFWRFEVGLTTSQLKACALEKPALLQYSVEDNLKPKLAFFRNDLNISVDHLIELTVSQPVMWGYSLDKNLVPSAQAFVQYCGNRTLAEYGCLVIKVPQLLRSSWKTNLSLKLQFFRETLALSDDELCTIVNTVPWIMFQSMSTLELKISIFREQAGSDGVLALKKNPSLLLSSVDALDKRVRRCLERTSGDVTVFCLLTGSDNQKASSGGKAVHLLKKDSTNVEVEFASVIEAARYAGLSQSTMYRVLKQNLPVQGRQFVYAKPTERVIHENEVLQENAGQSPMSLSVLENDSQMNCLCIDVAGYAYPPAIRVRGRKRTGGMALHVSSASTKDWRKWTEVWKGRKFRLLEDQKTVILGYHYIRSSRPRCSLYACHEALRIARLWLSDIQAGSAEIEIKSDSSYAVDLLQNTTRLLEWGKMTRPEECDFTELGDVYRANPDILFTVARSLYFLVCQENMPQNERMQVQVHFSFSLASSKNGAKTRNGAKEAAKLMYHATR